MIAFGAARRAESRQETIRRSELLENAQFFKTYSVVYHDGETNSHLERVSEQPDIVEDILKPLTH